MLYEFFKYSLWWKVKIKKKCPLYNFYIINILAVYLYVVSTMLLSKHSPVLYSLLMQPYLEHTERRVTWAPAPGYQ